jgi:hypothetical protein
MKEIRTILQKQSKTGVQNLPANLTRLSLLWVKTWYPANTNTKNHSDRWSKGASSPENSPIGIEPSPSILGKFENSPQNSRK